MSKPAIPRIWIATFVCFSFANLITVRAANFHDIVCTGDVRRVKELIAKDPSLVNTADQRGYTPLGCAVSNNYPEMVHLLLDHGADVKKDARIMVDVPSAKIARLLIEHGAEFEFTDAEGRNEAMQSAANSRNVELADLLLANGVEMDFDSAVELGRRDRVAELLNQRPWLAKAPRTPLHTAAENGDLPMVKLLMKHGADPNLDYEFSNVSGPYTPLSEAFERPDYAIAKMFLEAGADTDAVAFVGKMDHNLLHYALGQLDTTFVQLLLDHGADVDVPDYCSDGITPLHVAASLGATPDTGHRSFRMPARPASESQTFEKAKLLIDHGANADVRTVDGATPLLFAALGRNDRVCELLLSNGAPLDFLSACVLGKHAEVEAMLKADAALAKPGKHTLSRFALHWCARSGNKALVETLLAYGADPNARAPTWHSFSGGGFTLEEYPGAGQTPLHVATVGGHADVVRVFLESGAKVNAQDNEGDTPLHSAAQLGSVRLVQLLLAEGADPNATNNAQETCIHKSVGSAHTEVTKILLAGGAEVHRRNKWGYTPLHKAVKSKQVVELLLEAGSDINAVSEAEDVVERPVKAGRRQYWLDAKNTPLRRATRAGNKEVVDLLIARGARIDLLTACTFGLSDQAIAILEENPNRRDVVIDNVTRLRPIDVAAQGGHLELVKRLLALGASLQPEEEMHRDASHLLHFAARHGRLNVVEYLFAQGSEVEVRDSSGATPLHAAAAGAQPELVRYLLERGAGVNATNNSGSTPLHDLANEFWWNSALDRGKNGADLVRRRRESANLLIAAGADVSAQDNYGYTPLHEAARSGATEVAKLLLANGANPNARTIRNETPLELTVGVTSHWSLSDEEAKPIIELFRRHGGVR